ncbi:MAG: LysM peptidoglycan-binding domain-containing protein [Treponema sp.]|jgi:nucleoid-associated protein YgaU|nr:LysM peptidoglycan-binding domain-containing protein [Treponema sp.]
MSLVLLLVLTVIGLFTLGCATNPVIAEGDSLQASAALNPTAKTESPRGVQEGVAPKSTEKTENGAITKAGAAPESTEKAIAPPSTSEYGNVKVSPNPVETKPLKTPPIQYSDLILEGAKTHKVVWGDTLSKIAKKYYGPTKGYYFPLIMLASGGKVLDPDLIIPGIYLSIPDLQKNLADPRVNQQLKTFFFAIAESYEEKGKYIIQYRLLQIAQSL